jgi:hypothetical protein
MMADNNASDEAELSDSSIDETIAAYEGPAALPAVIGTQCESTGRSCFYVVTNGRRMGIFSNWYVLISFRNTMH